MPIKRLEVQKDHLERLVKTPAAGVEELVWNAIDADADTVECRLVLLPSGGLDSLTISDNGEGITEERANISFERLGGSWKKQTEKTEGGRGLHGQAGQGRLAAFGIGDWVRWTSTSEAVEGGGLRTIEITGRRGNLQEIQIEVVEPPRATKGTTVEISQLSNGALKWLESPKAPDRLTSTFALSLEKYGVDLRWDGRKIDPRDIQSARWSDFLTVEALGADHEQVELVIIEWKIPEGRKLLLCDSSGAPLHETNVGIQAPGFNFTAYIKWEGFKEHAANLALADFAPDSVQAVLAAGRVAMKSYFSDRVRSRGSELVKAWKDDDIYPFKEQPSSEVERAERELFEIVAVTAADAFKDTDKKSKRLSLHLIKEALENNPGGLQDVLGEVIGLPESDLADLGALLKETTLSNIIRSTREITDRLKFVSGLEEIIYGDDFRKTILERKQLHRILAAETWVFREEYQLTADDTTLKTALDRYGHLLKTDDPSSDEDREREVLDHTGGIPVVDLILSRVVEQQENKRHHIVIEIKRPTVHIGHNQISQIERYAASVVDDGRFDLASTTWEFWIVGDKIANAARMKTARGGVIQEPSAEYPVTIRAVSWSQIIRDARHRLKFVQDGLSFGPTNVEVMKHLRQKHGSFLPGVEVDVTITDGDDDELLKELDALAATTENSSKPS
ncbi:ATP-binding protein [Paenarthrobacter sp. NPDC056912]|uniref:ATP-binding protein n=1 Tax=Paenarthrobacter sp. NPDC056912 TaxID=3345965 RepID=UPI00366BEEF2